MQRSNTLADPENDQSQLRIEILKIIPQVAEVTPDQWPDNTGKPDIG